MWNRLLLLALVVSLGCEDNQAARDAGVGCAGQLGCPCDSTGKCDDATAFCDSMRNCSVPKKGCTPGELECMCAGGGCNSGLGCLEGVCRDNTGFAGGKCLPESRCHTGHRCAGDLCVRCTPGTQGCTCAESGCNETLECKDGMCVASAGFAAATPPPATLTSCVTPCSAGLVAPDGTWVPCPADGVMPGCLPGLACTRGQCLCAGASPHTCTADVDCPDFHTCLDGFCRTNCASSAECRADAACFRRVCRKACDVGTPTCPDGLICHPFDGQRGVCLMRADIPVEVPATAATLTVSKPALRFTPSATKGKVDIQNTSAFDAVVVVRRARQHEPDPMTKEPTTLELLARESAAAVDADSCTTGTRGCRCGADSALPCAQITPSFALACEEGLCQLPACTAGTAGCVCDGANCRLLCETGRCPLAWLTLAVEIAGTTAVAASSDVVVSFALKAGQTASLTVDGPMRPSAWDGALEIEPRGAGAVRQDLLLSSANTPEGRWAGELHYFGDFLVSQAGLTDWRASRGTITTDPSFDGLVSNLENAFLEKWATFRRGSINLAAFLEVLTATRTESWRSPALVQPCGTNGWICYPSDTPQGYTVYTQTPSKSPVPAGVVEVPFALTLAPSASDPKRYLGSVDSTVALQYPGSPGVGLGFAADPAACKPGPDGNCLVFLDSFSLTSLVGGRYPLPATAGAKCPARYRAVTVPWLVPGFDDRSRADSIGRRYLHDCREAAAPFAGDDDATRRRNGDLSAANPLADGKERLRTIELLDGVLVNGDTMLILFRERTPPLAGPADSAVVAYGFISLQRQDSTGAAPAAGTLPTLAAPPPEAAPILGCATATAALAPIASKLGKDSVGDLLDAPPWAQITRALIHGLVNDVNLVMKEANRWEVSGEQVHYLCEDTKRFDQGGVADGGTNGVECPGDSPVTYFTVDPATIPSAVITSHPCVQTATCDATLRDWIRQGFIVQLKMNSVPREDLEAVAAIPELIWSCANAAPPCNANQFELRSGKEFFTKNSEAVLLPLDVAVDEAFRYRTRFQNRSGKNLGFAPAVCGTGQQTLPYCYDPGEIVKISQRYDCLVEIFLDHYDDAALVASPPLQTDLANALRNGFSYRVEGAGPNAIYHPGFEKLRAELLVMLGDDAYTQALASRFDLAGLGVAAFEGALFESGGLNLSGVAGAEMHSLYLATQYYQLVLDRLSALLPKLWRILEGRNTPGGADDVIGQPAVIELLSRVIRASSQKARVQGEIAKRYQNLDRAELARRVIERAYVAGYLESAVLTTLMQSVARRTEDIADKPQIRAAIAKAQLTYRSALADMAERYKGITDQVNYFGFPADYIPFPALEAQAARDTAFDVGIARAKERVSLAKQAEDTALATTRSFDSDAVSFQNELARVSNTYEAQLSEICGTFDADGTVYPAIARYAHLHPVARLWGDPCGRMGTGQLHDAILEVQIQGKELQKVRRAMSNVLEEVKIEEDRISAACGIHADWEKVVVNLKGQQLKASKWIRGLQTAITTIDKTANAIAQTTQSVIAGGGAVVVGVTYGIAIAATTGLDIWKNSKETELEELQSEEAKLQFQFQCDAPVVDENGNRVVSDPPRDGLLQIDSRARVGTMVLRMTELEIEAAREQIQIGQTVSRVQQLANQARRISAEMEEGFQLTINLEAARNDPNTRIYRNDAVIQADVTFDAALREVYRATRVFEYYTSQSYADKEKLFLARMVSRGDANLDQYLIGLEDAFRAFEDDAGVPDLRVLVLSLRDHLLNLPYLTDCGDPISANDRVRILQRRLGDPAALDGSGYVVVPFRIGPEHVSPLTRNHKIRFVEAQIVGGSGDPVGRVYVRAAGAAMVSTLADELQLYSFPRRTGVVNVFFSVKSPEYDPQVFRTNRFADRPLMNSRWELVLNMKDEPANLDFAVEDINDVRLYFYYSDFTRY